MSHRYTEHSRAEAYDFNVVDATPGPHCDDKIWVGIYGEGRWLTAHEALGLAATIERAAHARLERLAKQTALPFAGAYTPPRNVSYFDARKDYPWGRDGHCCGENMDAPALVPTGAHRSRSNYMGSVVADGYRFRSGE
ncbi:hypothetical protein [Acidovorax delafieldii]|uniref:hypothetical protein n=1 Tax=Acidovorax delafieldii TaxID=47920 RepID=UPI003ECCA827